jgi:hypothetical protein
VARRAGALLAAALLTGCAAATSDGYSVTAPEGWEDRTDAAETKSGVDYQGVYEGPERDGVITTLIIDDAEPRRGRRARLADAAEQARDAVVAAAPGAVLSPARPARLAGVPARRFDASLGDARLSEVVAVHDGRAYTVTITGSPGGFGRDVEVFEDVLRSWRWD